MRSSRSPAPARRRSRLSRSVEETFDSSLMNTRMLALQYDPGEIRVRFHAFRDYVALLPTRYAAALLLAQLAYSAWAAFAAHEAGSGRTPFSELKVGDAVGVVLREAGWARLLLLAILVAFLLFRGTRTVYLVDFATFDAPEEWKVTKAELLTVLRHAGEQRQTFGEEDLAFMEKVLANSGTGDATAWPPSMVKCKSPHIAPDESMHAARQEAEMVFIKCVGQLLRQTNVRAKEVDFLIVNCSLFSPTPSLCAMISNQFGMRTNVKTFNLSGQGCSASLIAVDLAAELLQNNPHTTALVVSTEIISQSLYHGHEKAMLLQNTLFRCGGAAVMLSNKPALSWKAKYRLNTLVRTQCCDNESHHAVFQCEDGAANGGIRLSKKIVEVAGNAMKINLTNLGPRVLPLSEQIKVLFSIIGRGFGVKRYVPDFKTAIDFFCIHAGGRAVLDGIEKNLRLLPEDMLPSRTVLHERGNTSSSSIWYELQYVEEHKRLRRGHQVLQLAFGSGFKCNSAVWRRLR
ncbi:hypothetical protein AB1Y20_010268 [Prymnesium parvum]|uniref:very-long-chain 3-oxoacyl-CoA synthase n=1 Tax=Prymnesium parvum TaxID=97485 RepID=A0AB34K7V7_PRYPA